MKIITTLALLAALALSACGPGVPPTWADTPNPLDEPGESLPTAEDLHRENLSAITDNPAYR